MSDLTTDRPLVERLLARAPGCRSASPDVDLLIKEVAGLLAQIVELARDSAFSPAACRCSPNTNETPLRACGAAGNAGKRVMSMAESRLTGTTDIDPRLSCDITTGVQPDPSAAPKVQVWTCAACDTRWSITVTMPRPCPWLGHLAKDAAAILSVLRSVITLAEQAPEVFDAQLRSRLAALGRLVR